MKYRGMEYTLVQGIGRHIWKWVVTLGVDLSVSGQAVTKSEAAAEAGRTIDRVLATKKLRFVPRLKAASTRFGSAAQTKGFGVELVSARNRLIATWRWTREQKTPRLRRRLVSLAKKPSTALSQDAEVGVKWNAQRGCRASHLRGVMAQTPQGGPQDP